jgi:phthiodiolone/phenolphthiodiolone dimycocerosates ketoreductase
VPKDIIDCAVVDATSFHSPKEDVVEMTRRFTEAGVRVWLADQTLSWFPDGLWTPELAPVAREWPRNAYWDVYPLATYLAARVPDTRFLFSHDAIRRGPEILAQTMMTIQEFCGDAYFAIGGGEIKQLKPFGYVEEKPIARVRESIQMIKKFWDSQDAFSFEGKTMKLTNAHLGTRAYDGKRPKVMVVGTGPKLMEIGAQYADGIMLWMPYEHIPGAIGHLKEVAANADRDPEELLFWGAWPIGQVMSYDPEEDLEEVKEAPLTKFIAAAWGRMTGAAWEDEGFEAPLGRDWHYGKDMIPTEWSTDRVKEVINKVPREMVDIGVLFWTVEDMAQHFVKAIRAGIEMPIMMDWRVFVSPDQRWAATDRAIQAAQRAAEILKEEPAEVAS